MVPPLPIGDLIFPWIDGEHDCRAAIPPARHSPVVPAAQMDEEKPLRRAGCERRKLNPKELGHPMNRLPTLAAFALGASLMTHAAVAAPDAANDPRIDPQIRSFLSQINKDSSPFWELPQPKPQEI